MAMSKAQIEAKRKKMDLDAKILASRVTIDKEKERLSNLQEMKRDHMANVKTGK